MDMPYYTGNLNWLPARTIYMTRHGSHAYGTNVPESDEDLRGVCIAPKEYYLGYQKIFHNYIQAEPDFTVFELRKFLHLASECNPNVVELLFTDPSDHLYVHPLMKEVLEKRDLFLSQRAKHTFSGFAMAQLRKIERHAKWLKAAPVLPTRADFGLDSETLLPKEQLGAALSLVERQVETWTDFDYLEAGDRQIMRDTILKSVAEMGYWADNLKEGVWDTSAKSLGFESNFIKYLAQEKAYQAKVKEYSDYLDRKKGRNAKRAEIEEKFGFDTKYLLHAVRLMRSAEEILLEGKLLVRRPDAPELVSIRNGAWSLEKGIQYVKDMDQKLHELMAKSPLPKSPKLKPIEDLCISLVERSLDELPLG